MSTGFLIKTTANPKDGVHLSVTLDGTPSGSVTFSICRTPDFSKATAAAATLTAGVYAVATPHPALWYVWATDGIGTVDAPGCAWVGLSDYPDLDLCGQKLADILTANQAALNVALQTYFQDATIKHIVYGSASAITDFPAILVTKPVLKPHYVAMPYVREIVYQLEVIFTILHQDKAPMLTAASRFVSRIVEILNQPAYEGIVLDSGTPLAFCQCEEGEADETQYDENKYAAVGSLVWTGKALLQDSI